MIKIGFTIKFFLIALIAFIVITSWSEVVVRWLAEYFDWDREQISTWVKLGIGSTLFLIIVLLTFNIELHDLFGISETVDVQVTGMREKFKNGKVKHYRAK